MLMERTFNVVLVKDIAGVGVDISEKIDKVINYSGQEVSINF